MIVLRLFVLLALAGEAPALAAPAAASAGSPGGRPAPRLADTVTVLSGVEVGRERALSDARRLLPTAFVTDLRVDDRPRTTGSLAGLLAEAAGVHITQYGGLGAFSTLSLRGASPGQVTILLDGVPLTSAAHGVVSLGDLPATAVERVEVYRGLGPLGLGVATPGGAVNLVTVSSPGLRELHLSRGSFGTWEGRATGGLERGGLSLLLHAGYQGSAGDFPYLDDHGTAYNAADDTVRTRLNDRFDAWTALASAEWRPRPDLRARLRGDVFAKAQGLPGRGATPALGTRLAFQRSLSVAELERAGEGPVPRVTLRLSADRSRSRFRDLRLADRGELGFGRHDTDDRTLADALVLSLAWARPAEWLAGEAAVSLRREGADPHDGAAALTDPPGSRRDARGAMVRVQLQTPGGRLVLHAARRWDRIADHLRAVTGGTSVTASDVTRELDSPQLGARLGLGWGLEARANWARAARAPEFTELFGWIPHMQIPFAEEGLHLDPVFVQVRYWWQVAVLLGTALVVTLLVGEFRREVAARGSQALIDDAPGLFSRWYLLRAGGAAARPERHRGRVLEGSRPRQGGRHSALVQGLEATEGQLLDRRGAVGRDLEDEIVPVVVGLRRAVGARPGAGVQVLEAHQPGVLAEVGRDVVDQRLHVAAPGIVQRAAPVGPRVVVQAVRVELLGLGRVGGSVRAVRIQVEAELRHRAGEGDEGGGAAAGRTVEDETVVDAVVLQHRHRAGLHVPAHLVVVGVPGDLGQEQRADVIIEPEPRVGIGELRAEVVGLDVDPPRAHQTVHDVLEVVARSVPGLAPDDLDRRSGGRRDTKCSSGEQGKQTPRRRNHDLLFSRLVD